MNSTELENVKEMDVCPYTYNLLKWSHSEVYKLKTYKTNGIEILIKIPPNPYKSRAMWNHYRILSDPQRNNTNNPQIIL